MDKNKIRYIIGIICILGSFGGFNSNQPIPAIFILLFGISLLPILYEKTKLRNYNRSYIYIPIVTFIIFILALGINASTTSTNNTMPTKNKSTSINDTTEVPSDLNQTNIFFNVSQFSKITPEKLVSIMGEPDSKENWKDSRSETKSYDVIIYEYSNKYKFFIWNDQVVKLNIYAYNINELKNYQGIDKTFELLNIIKSTNIKKEVDTDFAVRYEKVTDSIARFWGISINDNTSIEYKIFYDQEYM